jgi:hypothetical protein
MRRTKSPAHVTGDRKVCVGRPFLPGQRSIGMLRSVLIGQIPLQNRNTKTQKPILCAGEFW